MHKCHMIVMGFSIDYFKRLYIQIRLDWNSSNIKWNVYIRELIYSWQHMILVKILCHIYVQWNMNLRLDMPHILYTMIMIWNISHIVKYYLLHYFSHNEYNYIFNKENKSVYLTSVCWFSAYDESIVWKLSKYKNTCLAWVGRGPSRQCN